MVDSFLKYLQFEKRVSPHTVVAYKTDLEQFESFLKTFDVSPETARYSDVRSWIIQLVESGLEAPSVNRKTACLRAFYKNLLREEVISHDPMLKIRALKTSKRLPHFLNAA